MITSLDKLIIEHLDNPVNDISKDAHRREQFASTYSNMMFDAMERTIEQSEALKEQMDEAAEQALKAWQLPSASDQDKTVDALNDLNAQVQALTKKVTALEKTMKKD